MAKEELTWEQLQAVDPAKPSEFKASKIMAPLEEENSTQ